MLVTPLALSGVKPYADWRQLRGDALIAPYHRPDKANIVGVGGETSPLWKISDFDYTTTVSIDKWTVESPASQDTGDREAGRGACEAPQN
jgi:hypothetical protein